MRSHLYSVDDDGDPTTVHSHQKMMEPFYLLKHLYPF